MIESIKKKKHSEQISMLTCYDYSFASILDGLVDIILVGDSMGNVVLGEQSTRQVTMEDIKRHLAAVRRGAPNTWIVADLPFSASRKMDTAVEQAIILMNIGADAVKPEGNPELVQALVESDIPVMSHLGLLPQTAESFKVVGRREEEAQQLLEQARQIEQAGAFSVVLECIPAPLAKRVTQEIDIPTIGIGSGPDCDGQVLVLYDLLGLFPDFKAKFVRQYLNLQTMVSKAVKQYTKDVKHHQFPSDEESFK